MMDRTPKKESDERIRTLAFHGLLTAVVTMLTLFASVPLPVGNGGAYLNAGDAAVFASAYILGPWGGAAVAAVGSALADVLHGSAVYAPATFIIKGLMALICAAAVRRLRGAAPFIAGLVMPLGYFAFECILYDVPAALSGLWMNGVQYVFGAAAAVLLFAAFKRAGIVLFGKGRIERRGKPGS
ncbi:MAG: ECF transporter S component [Clostridia bacterium]|nr:ECF transporter S component [Clostridia bacterium]